MKNWKTLYIHETLREKATINDIFFFHANNYMSYHHYKFLDVITRGTSKMIIITLINHNQSFYAINQFCPIKQQFGCKLFQNYVYYAESKCANRKILL